MELKDEANQTGYCPHGGQIRTVRSGITRNLHDENGLLRLRYNPFLWSERLVAARKDTTPGVCAVHDLRRVDPSTRGATAPHRA
jgi:hypothetical protein